MSEGELKKRILNMFGYTEACLESEDDLLVFELHELVDEAKKENPLNPIIEIITLHRRMKNLTEKEKNIAINTYLNNCNLKKFVLEAADHSLKWFGDSS